VSPGGQRAGLDERIGEVYLAAAELAARVEELGAELARDYAGRDPVLVGALKSCIPFVTDLSRAIPIAHSLDFVELSGYGSAALGGHERIRFIKDLDLEIAGRDVVIVDEVVDTGLTLHYLCRSLALRNPDSLVCATLFDRPYRRLVDALPIRYVGFTVPDEFFAGYGFDLDERWRNLPDLHLVQRLAPAPRRRAEPEP
jgi:hypoxanthine phosphoribosyltransferase